MRTICLAFPLLFWMHTLCGQQQANLDSLEGALDTADSPRQRLELYVKLAQTLRGSDSLNTVKYVEKAIDLARELNDPEREIDALYHRGVMLYFRSHFEPAKALFADVIAKSEQHNYLIRKADALNVLGVIANYQGDAFASIDNYEQSMRIQEALGNQAGVANALNNTGVIYEKIGNFGKALECLYRYLDLCDELGNKYGMATAYHNIGIIHKQVEDYEKALEVFEKSNAIKEGLEDFKGIADTNNSIGGIFLAQGQPEAAQSYFLKALEIHSTLNDVAGMIASYDNLGGLYTEIQEFEKATGYFRESLKMNETRGTEGDKSYPLAGLGTIEMKRGNFKKAANYFRSSLDLASQNGLTENAKISALSLAEAEAAGGNHEEAYLAYVLFKQMNDSINDLEQIQQIARIEAGYEFEQEKDSIQFANDREMLQLETALERRKWQQNATLIGLFVAVLFILFIAFFYHKLKKLNTEVIHQRDRLGNLNKTKNRFFSIVAHDLRGPMGVITGINYLLKAYLTDHKVQKDDELHSISYMLEESSNQSHHLMDSLLTWAIKEQEGIPYNPDQLNIMECFRETISILHPQANTKSIELEAQGEEAITGYLDKNTFLTILRNLAGNSIKFTPEGGKITLSTTQTADGLTVSITDTGTGIPPDKINSLFSLSTEQSSRGTKGEKGTGLGLNIVHDFVKMNKGEISVQSEEGRGTTFILLFSG